GALVALGGGAQAGRRVLWTRRDGLPCRRRHGDRRASTTSALPGLVLRRVAHRAPRGHRPRPAMADERIRRAIEGSDTDELVRIVDGLVQGRDWQAMRTVRQLCEEAVERGKQLWAIPEYIRYRLALDGPPES